MIPALDALIEEIANCQVFNGEHWVGVDLENIGKILNAIRLSVANNNMAYDKDENPDEENYLKAEVFVRFIKAWTIFEREEIDEMHNDIGGDIIVYVFEKKQDS